ncbi:tumor necrosis factor receptor superfamily member 1A isoform X2 [Melanotaenia boesemani]|uniref:tumor necrosis factor receptor superfamily member 1A isoform X2 n=1 Tax=Melanotaenia boesemani TaxID=1250792 RepID=UPI001C055B81|nr:tumor necrosis factor receptor superfamily member 1A isoform X2 [Melanotaenia boesemani]
MDFVWIVPVLLILLSSGQSHIELTKRASNTRNCPVGYVRLRKCTNSTAKDHCKQCGPESYMDRENQAYDCIRCKTCLSNQKVIQECAYNHDRQCACKDGYYFDQICHLCSSAKDCNKKENLKECCQSLNGPEGKKKFNATTLPFTNPPKTTTTSEVTKNNSHRLTATSATPTTPGFTSAKTLSKPSNPIFGPVPEKSWDIKVWIILIVPVVATSLVLCWLLLLIRRNSCPYLSTSKKLETPAQDPKSNGSSQIISASLETEHCSHQDNNLAMRAFYISEETPMMSFCQKSPAHNSNHLPDNNRMDRWPAIVLYAIIKEVPLRRWKEFLRLLSVTDQQMERVELEAGLGSIEKQYQMLRLWSQRSSANLKDVYSCLHYMDLSGCVQLLQESLEKLQWKPEAEQGSTP